MCLQFNILFIIPFIIQKYSTSLIKTNNSSIILKIIQNDIKVNEFNLTLITDISYFDIYSHIGKPVYLTEFINIYKYESLYSHFNKNWIFLIDDLNEALKYSKEMFHSNTLFSLSPMIIPSSLIPKMKIFNSQAKIFSVDDETFSTLKKYDMNKSNSNCFFEIKVNLLKISLSIIYLHLIPFLSIFITLITLFIWRLKSRELRLNYKFVLPHITAPLPLFNLVIQLVLLTKIREKYERKYENNLIYSFFGNKTFINFLSVMTRLLFKTLVWFFGIVVADGWELTYTITRRKQFKDFFKNLFVIYVWFCIDNGLNSKFSNELEKYTLIEVKNLIVYFVLVFIVLVKGRITYKQIKHKIFFANVGLLEHLPGLQLKLKMIKFHILINIMFYAKYLFMSYLLNTKIRFNEFKELHYCVVELILALSYVWLYFPRILPPFFLENTNKNQKSYRFIYKVNIKKNILENDFKSITHQQNKHKYKIDLSTQIVILNPNYYLKSKSGGEKEINHVINNILIGKPEIRQNEI